MGVVFIMTDWCNLSWQDVVNLFQSNADRGLNESKVLKSRDNYGRNEIKLEKDRIFMDLGKKILRPWLLFFIISITLCFANENFISAIILMIIFFISSFTIAFKKYRGEKKIILLNKFNSGYSNVIRNGNLVCIKNTEIVVGDIITYKEGSIIPADLRITNCDNLMVVEESITGDSSIVEKYSAKITGDNLELAHMKNILFKSSVVYKGTGEGIVLAVGENTEIGRFIKPIINLNESKSDFYETIYTILNKISLIAFASTIILLISDEFFRKINYNDYILILSTNLVALFPIGLIFIVIFTQFIVKKNSKKEKIFINDISKIQDIYSSNIICVDKLEIITEKSMILKKIYDTKEIQDLEKNFIINDNINRIMEIGILCNDVKNEYTYNDKDDLLEKAFLIFAEKHNIKKSILDKKQRRLMRLPFEEEIGIKTTVNHVDRKYRAYIKGTLDNLLKKCTHIMKNGIEKEISKEDIEEILNANISLLSEGFCVDAFGYRNFNYKPTNNENIQSNVVFAGLAAFYNPMKNEIKDNPIEKCRRMAIKPVIFTEENKLSAEAFGKKIGLLNAGDMVISDIEIDNMNSSELENCIEKAAIFSKIKPHNKLNLVNGYRNLNYKIIMTGNNLVNLSAFMRSYIHLSFGNKCSSIIRELSDIYFENIDFNKILDFIIYSKKIMFIIKKIITNLCIISFSEFYIYFLAVIFNFNIPFYFKHIFWNNIINGFLLSLAIFLNYKNIDYYENDYIDNNLWIGIKKDLLVNSAFIAVIGFLGFYTAVSFQSSAYITVTVSILYFSQLILVIKKSLLKNVYFNFILLAYIIINYIMLYTKVGVKIFGMKFVNMTDIKIITVFLILYGLGILFKSHSDK